MNDLQPANRLFTPARLAVALLVLTAQLFGYAHLALASHVVCATHGEVIDATPGAHADLAHVAADAAVPWAPRMDAPGNVRVAGHNEEQCAAMALLSATFMPRAAPAVATVRPETSRVRADAGADRTPTRLQLLLAAPKASPPARA